VRPLPLSVGVAGVASEINGLTLATKARTSAIDVGWNWAVVNRLASAVELAVVRG
jgi:hypothetical protein